ncbi:hypothetical protein [Methanobacterium sp.]|uniref:hypothetical protein n=1 Tax=Methanobacterium sp. TaxID=2164 RepID=UPI002AB9A9CE|nr:hypothetical protein [Methanobacterium sp.]MDY9924275.1 hypothetical protein [Methanobacterium sp.]
MISIITSITTTVNMGEIMNYSIIAVIFLLIFFTLRNMLIGEISKQNKVRLLVKNLNLVSTPLLIVFIIIILYRIKTTIP